MTACDSLQVHMPVLEPSTLLQLALFKETGPRGSRKAVLVGLLRLRLNSLTSEVDHTAELPMCSSRKQGGEKTATVGINIKVCFCPTREFGLSYVYVFTSEPICCADISLQLLCLDQHQLVCSHMTRKTQK